MTTYLLVIVSFALGFMFSALLGYKKIISDEKKKKLQEDIFVSDFIDKY